ncbi:uncharacterized protein TM35_000251220 [Trypanosoma theileri]|uniref:Uncharacterized protein n=1 Tax=Trypanosoma theileri TaxID=67003 RepID=A0A1X0NQ32_9TRYP|nr:uncharacterized protein TM35_000251220 [Trypanosoma theileri]ORC86826.1 hypothetical protein TM35_000251220 [Trypanosoma theileri]
MDLDDLLGADPPQTDPLSIDDVLGSPVKPTTTGGVEEETTDATARLTEEVSIPKLRRAPAEGPLPPRVHPIPLSHFKDPPPHVKPYMTNACYYANQVSLIQHDGSRLRRGIVISDSHLYIMTPEAQVERAVPLLLLEALYLQDIPTVKVLGMSKELQTHMLLQLREPPDVLVAFASGDSLPPPDTVLAALLNTHDVDLPISRSAVNSNIDIRRLTAWSVTDTVARQTCAAIHAHRTNIIAALNAARQRSAALAEERDKRTAALEAAIHATAAVARETAVVVRKNEAMTSALQQAATSLERCRAREQELRAALHAQQQQRQARVRERAAQQQGNDIIQHALEHELMRDAHRGEMRHLKLRRDFLLRRKSICDAVKPGQQAKNNADLEGLMKDLTRMRRETEKRREATAEALSEAKKRLAESKGVLKRVTEEVAVLRQLPLNEPIPGNYNREMAPTFLPVLLPEGSEENQGDVGEVNIPPATGAKNEKKAAAVIVVDDDDDDDDDLPLLPAATNQQSKQPPANTKPTIQFDDDDL